MQKNVSLSCSFRHRPPQGSFYHWWKKLKAAVNWSPSEQIPALSVNGSLRLSPEEKADAFKKIFANQCSTPSVAKISSLPLPSEQFIFQCIPEESVSLALQKLNVWKATGLDQISNRLLKQCSLEIGRPLSFIFDLSLKSGVYPSQ